MLPVSAAFRLRSILDPPHELRRGSLSRGSHGRSDADRDQSRVLQERISRPAVAGVVRDRQHRRTGLQSRATRRRPGRRRRAPGALRVPSGKIDDAESRARGARGPARPSAAARARPSLRSIAIGESIARPQPKNGIHRSSRLITQTCGGKIDLQRERLPRGSNT